MPVPMPSVQPHNVTSQSITQSPRHSAAKVSRDSCNDILPNTRWTERGHTKNTPPQSYGTRGTHANTSRRHLEHQSCVTMTAWPFATQQRQLRTEQPPKVNEYAAIDCNRRILVAHSRRMLLPHAQHRQNDNVQRTYKLQHRRIHHHAKPSRPSRYLLRAARKNI